MDEEKNPILKRFLKIKYDQLEEKSDSVFDSDDMYSD